MRVLICPDSFANTVVANTVDGALSAPPSAPPSAPLSAPEVAAAVVDGWRDVAPDDELSTRPLSGGGWGFLDAVEAALGGRRFGVPTVDPIGRPTTAEVLVVGETAYLESAQSCGLHLLAADERDPKITTTYGLGSPLVAAVETGVRRVVVGLGGSGTNDGGAGLLAAIDAAPLDTAGYALPFGGGALLACAGLGGRPRLRPVDLVAATDADTVLTGVFGASAVDGPGKGADRSDVRLLDAALTRFAEVLERELGAAGVAALPGAGVAGGLGAALLALGARLEPAIALLRRLTRFDDALDATDLVITGDGSSDPGTLAGTVVSAVAEAARDRGVPCVVVAGGEVAGGEVAGGEVGGGGVGGGGVGGGVEESLTRPVEGLRAIAARLAAQWSRPR